MNKLSALKINGLDRKLLGGDLRGLPPARITHEEFGIVGPPNRTWASVRSIRTHGKKTSIIWDDNGQQVMDPDLNVLQFFAPSEVDYAKVDLEWRNLTEKCRPQTRHVPPGSFVLMTGFPGSGKTTLSKAFFAELGILHFEFSEFAKRVVGQHPVCQVDYIRVGTRVESLISDYLNCGGSVIYDTTAIDSSIRQHHFDAIPRSSPRSLVWVPTESTVCHQRLSSQRPCDSPDLRPGLTRVSVTHVRTYNDFVIGFAPPRTAVIVPNDHEIRDACRGVLESLRSQS